MSADQIYITVSQNYPGLNYLETTLETGVIGVSTSWSHSLSTGGAMPRSCNGPCHWKSPKMLHQLPALASATYEATWDALRACFEPDSHQTCYMYLTGSSYPILIVHTRFFLVGKKLTLWRRSTTYMRYIDLLVYHTHTLKAQAN